MNDNTEKIAMIFGDGNDAAAWGAEDAGVSYVSHYPGAPVSRVATALAAAPRAIIFNHALNEHIAALAAVGASLCGARSLVVMKHVGLNIAADPLNYAGAVKIKGGMVIVVGTDPGARSSTGEEDVHWYAPQFNFPLLEPATVQGVYDAVSHAFELSERSQLPVLVFVPGRIAYQSSLVKRRQQQAAPREYSFNKDPQALINVGLRAVNNHREQLLRQAEIGREGTRGETAFNPGADFGIITRGASFAVACEAIDDLKLAAAVHLLNVERTFPLHTESLLAFAEGKRKLVVMEDQDGFLETMLKREAFGALSCPVQGKDIFPAWGELSYEQVREFLAKEFDSPVVASPALPVPVVADRPGACCEGCPHRPALFALQRAMGGDDGIIGGDIGCSSLPPHRTDWLLCMNAGIGISQGIAQILPNQALVSTGGDGSLFHGGLLALQSAVANNLNLIHVVLDNQSVAMTGHQLSPTSGGKLDVKGLLQAIGVRHIFEVNAFMPSLTSLALEKARTLHGVKVIWVKGECALQSEAGQSQRRRNRTLRIAAENCLGCTRCYTEFQCPAIVREENGQFRIDSERCRRCGACLDLCPNNAILVSRPGAPFVGRLLAMTRAIRRVSFRLLTR